MPTSLDEPLLFTVGATPLIEGNQVIFNALEAEFGVGEVHLRDDDDGDKTLTGYAAGILGSDTSSGKLAGYATAPEGIVDLAHATWDTEFDLHSAANAISNSSTQFMTFASSHDIVTGAGFVDTQQITAFSPASSVRYTTNSAMPAAATILSRYAAIRSDSVAAWCFETGALLADGTTPSPGRRIASAPLSDAAQNATPELLALLISEVKWAAGVSSSGPPSGGSAATVTITATGGGHKRAVGGSGTAVTVTATGGGRKVSTGGSGAAVTVTGTGAGHKVASGGTPAGVTVTTVGGGHKTASGGSAASITLTASGGGHKVARGGSGAVLTVTTTGGGHNPSGPPSGGSASALTVTATGGGHKTTAGGSTSVLTVITTGAGLKRARGGSSATVTITATGGGSNPASARDITVTGTLDPRRWDATLPARTRTGALSARRWSGALT